MDDFLDLQTQVLRWWMHSAQAGADAFTTISRRMPMLVAEGLSGRPPSRETRRMVSEKFEAAAEGLLKGMTAGGNLAIRGLHGQLNPALLASGLLAIADAAQRPAQRRVRANARRLTR